ncbi:nuclear transport factor 2 family protein [Streptomyces tendae]|uniref:nuclear transport factor 2 family protein n=1 Tax=Streptomyces tendae TaxID=1932 RepID=UPI0036B428A8
MDAFSEIGQLVLKERQGRDRGWWDQMGSCFAEDALLRLSWFCGSGAEFVAESRKMAARGDSSVHRLSPPVIHLDGDRALVEVPAVIEMRTVVDGIEADLASRARLYYRTQRHAGRWLITAVDPVYEGDTLAAAHPGTTLPVGPADVAAFRPSYRFLSYVLAKRGYTVGDDLYGDDRPAEAADFYAHAFRWLHSPEPGDRA